MATDRSIVIQNERLWHDNEAHRRTSLNKVLYAPPAFDELIEAAFDFMNGRPHELILDMGCGEGKETVSLAMCGLRLVSMDLSHKQVQATRERLLSYAPDSLVFFVQANAEEPPFARNSFDAIYGKAILHHLDLTLASQEIKRLLKPNGRATFAEPLGQHPLFWLGRRLTPQLRTKDEHPLRRSQFTGFARAFHWSEMRTFYLLAPLAYPLRLIPGGEKLFRKLYSFLSNVDKFLFSRFDRLQTFAWYGIVNVKN